ncbi:MAG: hypothetical protein NT120_00685 [Candidatus Aenigmarchaeota archaeon]|nr:hypothetical protein [Candidatus Aenigmarchaeota archaeon]
MFTDLHEVFVNVCEYPISTLMNLGLPNMPIITKLTFEGLLWSKIGIMFTRPS